MIKRAFLLTILLSTAPYVASQTSIDGEAPLPANTPAGGNATGTLDNLTITGVHDENLPNCGADGTGWRKQGGVYVCTSLLNEDSAFTGCANGNQANGLDVTCVDDIVFELTTPVIRHSVIHNGSTYVNAVLTSADIDHNSGTVATAIAGTPDQSDCVSTTPITPTAISAYVRTDVSANNVQITLPDCDDDKRNVTVENCTKSTAFARQVRVDSGDNVLLPSGGTDAVGVDLTDANAVMDFRCNGEGQWSINL